MRGEESPSTTRHVLFADRVEAGRRLGRRLEHLRSPDVVVLGLPRGGVLVAREVADLLGAPLDVLLVRKLGVPAQPELAMGAIGEEGARVLNRLVIDKAGVTTSDVAGVEARERGELERRARALRPDGRRLSLLGRVAIVVDDGVATGATARVACLMARAGGPRRLVLAVPVAPPGWERDVAGLADELVAVATPSPFRNIGSFYDDFAQATDEDVLRCLAPATNT